MPDPPSPSRRLWPSRGRSGKAPASSEVIGLLRSLRSELLDAEEQVDEALGRRRLPDRLLRMKRWNQRTAETLRGAGLGELCLDLESAYAEVKRLEQLRYARMWQMYVTKPGDQVEEGLARIRYALDRLEPSIASLAGGERGAGA